MASVEAHRGPRGTSYLVRWRDEAGRSRRKTFYKRADADRYRAQVEHSLNVGAYVDPAAGRESFRAYAERWRVAQPHRPNTAARVASQLLRHVYPVLGDRRIASIRPSEVQALVTGLGVTLAPGSVRTLMATVGAVFAAAARDRVIGLDPAAGVALPEVPRKRITPLTVEQVQALVDAAPDRYRALVVTVAGTGLRQGEAFGLQVRDVDFLRRVVRVERQVQPGAGGPVIGPLKNRSAYRSIPVGATVVDELAAHLKAWPAAGEQFVFRTPAGTACSRTAFNARVWTPLRAAAGLPGVGMHDLRHFYASALIRAGLNVRVVSERLGHANAAMTLNVYSHLWPDDEDRTRSAIDDLFRSVDLAVSQRLVPQACHSGPARSTSVQVTRLARPPPVIWRWNDSRLRVTCGNAQRPPVTCQFAVR